ncbi:MAG: hypothetical protein ACOVNR_06305 [Chitinophagaceae bacterium]
MVYIKKILFLLFALIITYNSIAGEKKLAKNPFPGKPVYDLEKEKKDKEVLNENVTFSDGDDDDVVNPPFDGDGLDIPIDNNLYILLIVGICLFANKYYKPCFKQRTISNSLAEGLPD